MYLGTQKTYVIREDPDDLKSRAELIAMCQGWGETAFPISVGRVVQLKFISVPLKKLMLEGDSNKTIIEEVLPGTPSIVNWIPIYFTAIRQS